MTDPATYINGRTVQEQMNSLIGYVDQRSAEVALDAIAADVAVQNKRITAIEEGNKVLCQGIVALLSHEINGNSIDKLRQAQTDLTNYLINK